MIAKIKEWGRFIVYRISFLVEGGGGVRENEDGGVKIYSSTYTWRELWFKDGHEGTNFSHKVKNISLP